MKTTDLGAVAPLYPVNGTAARVSGKGEHYEPKIAKEHARWHAPPPVVPHPVAWSFKDMTGLKLGRLTVHGYAGSKAKYGSMWFVRCNCGMYEVRRSKFLKNPENAPRAMCSECDRVNELRRSYSSVDKLRFHDLPRKNPAGA